MTQQSPIGILDGNTLEELARIICGDEHLYYRKGFEIARFLEHAGWQARHVSFDLIPHMALRLATAHAQFVDTRTERQDSLAEQAVARISRVRPWI